MELVRRASRIQVASLNGLLIRGRSAQWEASHARSFSAITYRSQASNPSSNKQDFPSTDHGLSPVLDSTTDPSLVCEVSAHGGDLASLGLGGNSPVGLLQSMIEMVHVNIGLPWWGSIALCAAATQLAALPLHMNFIKLTFKLDFIHPDIDKLRKALKFYKKAGNVDMMAVVNAKMKMLYDKNGCTADKSLSLLFYSVSVFITYFLAIRGMVTAPVESMKTGGMLWFTDLTVVDPYCILPFFNAAMKLLQVEVREKIMVNILPVRRRMINGANILFFLVVSSFFPTGFFMCWTTGVMFRLGTHFIFLIQKTSLKGGPVSKHP